MSLKQNPMRCDCAVTTAKNGFSGGKFDFRVKKSAVFSNRLARLFSLHTGEVAGSKPAAPTIEKPL